MKMKNLFGVFKKIFSPFFLFQKSWRKASLASTLKGFIVGIRALKRKEKEKRNKEKEKEKVYIMEKQKEYLALT